MDDVLGTPCLRALRWTRIRGAVRNTRAAGARDHPLWILHGMLLFAMPETQPGKKTFFTFRPLDNARDAIRPLAGIDDAVQRDEVYRFEVIFPGDDLKLPALFAARLERHLEDLQRNFVLVNLDRPALRCLGDLEDAASPWPSNLSEICLEFRTPLAYTPKNDRRPWELGAADLGSLFAHRLRHLFEQPSPAPPEAWTRLATLSNYWEFVEHPHRSPQRRRG